ncbi:hypothetical protein [Oceanobacillus sp. 1P07AA]|uniref:hypothetical protein n=1 Tax=Oceanobacillus sp. 1P07AA TaxID=3132293 RepID=UPI0039A69008
MSQFFLNNPNTFSDSSFTSNTNIKFGDKLIYYGGMVSTVGAIIAFIGSSIVYEEDLKETEGFSQQSSINQRQLQEMQQQIQLLQRKIDQLEQDQGR